MALTHCVICGVEYKTKPVLLRNGRTKYCSKVCAKVGWKGQRRARNTEFGNGGYVRPTFDTGTITIRTDHNGKRRTWRKTPAGWRENAKCVWEEKHGHLKAGDVVHHLDGTGINDDPNNLIALPRAMHPALHSKWGLKPPSPEVLKWLRARYS